MMKLFENDTKKIVIGRTQQEVDQVIRGLVLESKKPIFNVEKQNIISLAGEVINNSDAYQDYQLVDSNEAKALFYVFLKNNIKGSTIFGLIPKESFSIPTANNAYSAINQIRKGKLKEDKQTKYSLMIDEFEKYLLENKILDEALVLKAAIKLIENNKNSVLDLLGYSDDLEVYILPSLKDKLTYLEKKLINKLFNSFEYISLLKTNSVEKVKVPAYGYTNVVKYIINEIKDKNYNLDDVAIYTSSNAYDSLIEAYFDNYNIKYKFNYGTSILYDDLLGLFNSILDFLDNHFNINYLYSIYRSPALKTYTDEHGKEDTYACFNKIKDFKADANQLQKQASKLQSKEKKEFLLDLVDLYNETDNLSSIFKKVLAFCVKYSTIDKANIIELLNSKNRLFSFCDPIAEEMSYSDKILYIKSIVSSIKATKDSNNKDSSSVLVDSFNALMLPRKYNFFIGLSSKELLQSEVESPLISDDEYDELLNCDDYYVKKVTLANEEFLENVNNLLKTQESGRQYFVAPIYDSIEFKELSKSSLYLSIDGIEEEIYCENEEINTSAINPIDVYLYPQTAANIEKVGATSLTPSRVETIMNCPLKYIYSQVYDEIKMDEYSEKWLKGGEEGTFAHKVLQDYFDMAKGEALDKDLFDKVFKEAYEQMKDDSPFSSQIIQDVEASRVEKILLEYLDRYYKDSDDYKVFDCEFEEINKQNPAKYTIGSLDLDVNGTIDRLDMYVDRGELKIRIIDYKTYNKQSYDDHKKNSTLPQCILYPVMINTYVNNNYDELVKKVGHFNKR